MQLPFRRGLLLIGMCVLGVTMFAQLYSTRSEHARRREVEQFGRSNVREPLQRLRTSYSEESIRELIDACMVMYDREVVTFAYVSMPGNVVLHYAQVIDAERPGTYLVAFNIDLLRSKVAALRSENYEDFLVLVYLHECLHIKDANGGTATHADQDAGLKAESRTWWDATEYLLVPMRESGRATEVLDVGMELAIRFYLACGDEKECDLWRRFMAAGHRVPGAQPVDELIKELSRIE